MLRNARKMQQKRCNEKDATEKMQRRKMRRRKMQKRKEIISNKILFLFNRNIIAGHCGAFGISTQAPGGYSARQFRNQQAYRNIEYNIIYLQSTCNQQAYRNRQSTGIQKLNIGGDICKAASHFLGDPSSLQNIHISHVKLWLF